MTIPEMRALGTGMTTGTAPTFWLTCMAGCEFALVEECKNRFPDALVSKCSECKIRCRCGRVFITLPWEDALNKFPLLQGAESVFLVLLEDWTFSATDDGILLADVVTNFLSSRVADSFWNHALTFWKSWRSARSLSSQKPPAPGKQGQPHHLQEELRFRVSAQRTGDHTFTSCELARSTATAINSLCGWQGAVRDHQLDILCILQSRRFLMGLKLGTTRSFDSLKDRHRVKSSTMLRPSICCTLVSASGLNSTDTSVSRCLVVDPVCGSGTISQVCTSMSADIFFLNGDSDLHALEASVINSQSMQRGRRMDFVRWDVSRLPLRSGTVDFILADLPFGQRVGSTEENHFLYPAAMRCFKDVLRLKGRATLLTTMKKLVLRELKAPEEEAHRGWQWNLLAQYGINHGGLSSHIFVLGTTALTTNAPIEKLSKDKEDVQAASLLPQVAAKLALHQRCGSFDFDVGLYQLRELVEALICTGLAPNSPLELLHELSAADPIVPPLIPAITHALIANGAKVPREWKRALMRERRFWLKAYKHPCFEALNAAMDRFVKNEVVPRVGPVVHETPPQIMIHMPNAVARGLAKNISGFSNGWCRGSTKASVSPTEWTFLLACATSPVADSGEGNTVAYGKCHELDGTGFDIPKGCVTTQVYLAFHCVPVEVFDQELHSWGQS